MRRKIHIAKEVLEKAYLVEKKSCREIARELNISDITIRRRLKEFDIRIRTISEARMGKKYPSLRGREPWNKNLSICCNTGRTHFKKGHIPFNKNKTYERIYGVERANEIRKKLSESHKRQKSVIMDKTLEELVGYKRACHIKENMSIKSKKLWEDEAYRKNQIVKHKKIWENPEFRKKMSKIRKELWQDPKFIKKMTDAWKVKPTKPELKLSEFIRRVTAHYPYNGDFRLGVSIGGKIPDFPNVNGEKKLIELFGDYWHTKKARCYEDTEEGRIAHFNKFGWECLIIWEHELKEPENIIGKIREFIDNNTMMTQCHPDLGSERTTKGDE